MSDLISRQATIDTLGAVLILVGQKWMDQE